MADRSTLPGTVPDGEGGRQLSIRAKVRLEFAAGLLHSSGVRIDKSRGFFAGVLKAIERLPEAQKQSLREHVDWVEDYSKP